MPYSQGFTRECQRGGGAPFAKGMCSGGQNAQNVSAGVRMLQPRREPQGRQSMARGVFGMPGYGFGPSHMGVGESPLIRGVPEAERRVETLIVKFKNQPVMNQGLLEPASQ